MINKGLLKEYAQGFGIQLDETALDRFDFYAKRLVEKNKTMNLTSIVEPQDIAVKYFADSLSLISKTSLPRGAKVIDIGTGAGFPGVPLLIARPDLKMTLLDGTGKKLRFIEETLHEMDMAAEIIHARAEDSSKSPEHREMFDFAASRAVAELSRLVEYCLPFVKVGGVFAAMKAISAEREQDGATAAIKLLGGGVPDIKRFFLPDGSERSLIFIKKISQTPTKYPRPSAKIAKRPLG
ncbi:MAG: 16S rRNA (guanine(527)-N(7))-methyltransferase RsmG [Clostridiales bacterium]|jgi:16S rRNA (guanine527-N7)-methyltransferase|nr:16S rRNA (guanine(527)-N(7))-methyltransferase RsmG [Clostridiales bacterium]